MNASFLIFICSLFDFFPEGKIQSQLDKYMVFYFPANGQFVYEITFDWGAYVIDTGAGMEEALSKESEKYKGYISMRPYVSQNPPGEALFTYLITAEGEVFLTSIKDIPELSTREEVKTEKTSYGTSTSTTTITSRLEPVVEHYLKNKELWEKYAEIKGSNGKYSLKKVK